MCYTLNIRFYLWFEKLLPCITLIDIDIANLVKCIVYLITYKETLGKLEATFF